jgi:hypothetical protein
VNDDRKETAQNPLRVPLDNQSDDADRHADILMEIMRGPSADHLARHPWDRIVEIKGMASRLLEHPPAHPEKKRPDIIRKIEEIGRLADELLQDMPKSRSWRGAVGLE